MMMEPITLPVDRKLIDRVESLQSAAEYIKCLLEIVGTTAATLRSAIEKNNFKGDMIADFGDWQQIQTLLCLAGDQADIVEKAARDVEIARLAR